MSMPDIERYRSYVDKINATQAEKDEVIRIVWRIMEDFIDKAFGTHPAQQIPQIAIENPSISARDCAKVAVHSAKVKRTKPAGLIGGPR